MSKSRIVTLVAGISVASQTYAAVLLPAPIDDMFVPVGFDDNDEVIAVVDGWLPDTCFKLATAEAAYDPATGIFTVTQYAWHHTDLACLPVETPFTSEVRLGVLKSGSYRVVATGARPQTLEVAPSGNDGPDDFLYGAVDTAVVRADGDSGHYVATIEGRVTNSCLEWREWQLVDSGKTLQVLPIVDFVDSGDCQAVSRPFAKTLDLGRHLAAGRHLLHVRSLNGKAVNTVFTVYVRPGQ